jgi:hypothetical protein
VSRGPPGHFGDPGRWQVALAAQDSRFDRRLLALNFCHFVIKSCLGTDCLIPCVTTFLCSRDRGRWQMARGEVYTF